MAARGGGRLTKRRLTLLLTLLILLGGLALRLESRQAAQGHGIIADEKEYVVPAELLTRSGQYQDTFVTLGSLWTRVPLTGLLLALAFETQPALPAGAPATDAALMADRLAAGNLALCLVNLALIPLVILLAAAAFPARPTAAALLAGAFTAAYPPLIDSAAQHLMSEPLFITLGYAALLALTRWQPEGRTWRPLLIAGLLLGLAALTRPAALTVLPVCALWLVIVAWTSRPPLARRPFIRAAGARLRCLLPAAGGTALLAVVFLLVISPWVTYNFLHYGRFLLLDTAGSFTLWEANNYNRDDRLAALRALPNPVDRDALSSQASLAGIAAHPDQFLQGTERRLGAEWHLELQSAIKPSGWDLTRRDADVPEVIPSDLAFLLASLVGLAGLASAIWRPPRDRAGRVRLALALWIVPVLINGAIVPLESRYRLPAMPALLIFAAGLLVTADWRGLSGVRHWGRHLRGHARPLALALVLCAWVLAGAGAATIPPAVRALTLAWLGDQTGGATQAAWDTAAIAALPDSFWPYRHAADHARLAGRDQEARRLYAAGVRARPRNDDNHGLLGLADLMARHPEWALTRDEQDWLAPNPDDLRGPAWNGFAPTPRTQLSLGTDRDWGYIQGFRESEQTGAVTFRWSGGRGEIRLPAPPGAAPAGAIRLRLAALPHGSPPTTIRVAGRAPVQVVVAPGWADYTLPLSPPVAGALDIRLDSPVSTPHDLDPASRDTRLLGVAVQWVQRVP